MSVLSVRLCPRLEADPMALQRIFAYALASDIEVSGLGIIKAEPPFWPECLFITDNLYLPKQEGSAGQTELDSDALLSFTHQLTVAGKNVSQYRLWWHSHVGGAVFFSFQDTSTINALAKTWPFVVALVVNHHAEARCRVISRTSDLELEFVLPKPNQATLEACKQEVAQKVTQRKYEWPLWKKGSGKWDDERGLGLNRFKF